MSSSQSVFPATDANRLQAQDTRRSGKLRRGVYVTVGIGLLLLLAYWALSERSANLAGTWLFTVEFPKNETSNPAVAIEQRGINLEGAYRSGRGAIGLRGKVWFNNFRFEALSPRGSILVFKGTMDSDQSRLTGTVESFDGKTGTFYATRR